MLLTLSVISEQGASLGPSAYKVFDERGGWIGRLNSNDWVLPDSQKLVSSRHAHVRCVGGAFFVEDASTNGTFVNAPDRRVPKDTPTRLQDGDRILIGDYQILVQLIDNNAASTRDESQPALGPLLNGGAQSVAPLPIPGRGAPMPVSQAQAFNGGSAGNTQQFVSDTPGSAFSSLWGTDAFPSDALASDAFAQPSAGGAAALSDSPLSQSFASASAAIPPETTVNLTSSPEDLLLLLGIDPSRVDTAIYQQLGHILRIVVQGMIDVLSSRAEVKSQFRMTLTNIRPVENNPLKFSMNADDALHNLFVKRNPGYLPPTEAFREGFQDIAFHQMAMLAGVRAAFNAMLASFHPDHLEDVYERKLKRTALFGFANRLRYWDLYRAQFEDIEKNMENHFQLLFGEEFAKAYAEQLQKLASATRSGTR